MTRGSPAGRRDPAQPGWLSRRPHPILPRKRLVATPRAGGIRTQNLGVCPNIVSEFNASHKFQLVIKFSLQTFQPLTGQISYLNCLGGSPLM